MTRFDALLNCIGDVSSDVRHAVGQLIDDGVVASAVYRETTESTNSDALAELQSGDISDAQLPRLYLADRQTAGRGRQGNAWVSRDGALTFSLAVDIDLVHTSAAVLSPAVGVAVARALEFLFAPCRIFLKWPNDICVFWASKSGSDLELHKLGGILIETAAGIGRRCVIGVGMNLNAKPDLDGSFHTPPVSLAEVTTSAIRRAPLLAAQAESLMEMFQELATDDHDLIDQYRSRCAITGKELSLICSGQVVTGYCVGIADDGSLELVIDGRRTRFRSGEVRRVRSV